MLIEITQQYQEYCFLFDRIVEECVISKAEAIDKLSLLKEMNIRLPESAITERLDRWAE